MHSRSGMAITPVALRRRFAIKPFGRHSICVASSERCGLRNSLGDRRGHFRIRCRRSHSPRELGRELRRERGLMLRLETESDGNLTTIRVIGRLQASEIEDLRLALKDVESRAVLDLSELLLVDLPVVRFLGACEDEGVELRNCPRYIREWISRERGAR
jgi:hypothetical protein